MLKECFINNENKRSDDCTYWVLMDIGKANDLESVCTINLHNLSLIVHEMHSYAVKYSERKKNNTSG